MYYMFLNIIRPIEFTLVGTKCKRKKNTKCLGEILCITNQGNTFKYCTMFCLCLSGHLFRMTCGILTLGSSKAFPTNWI